VARVFVITGPSGVGKGTLIRGLMERVPQLELSVSATTRAPREGEHDGVDYHFLTREEFDRRVAAGDFVEHADYAGRSYGTLRSELEERVRAGVPVVLEIEVQGARQVRQAMPEAVQVFIAPPSLAALRTRLIGRGTDDRAGGRAPARRRRGRARREARVRARRRQRPARRRARPAQRDRRRPARLTRPTTLQGPQGKAQQP
jgi:guanylate kinase